MEKVKRKEEVRGGDSDAKKITIRVCTQREALRAKPFQFQSSAVVLFLQGVPPLAQGGQLAYTPSFLLPLVSVPG